MLLCLSVAKSVGCMEGVIIACHHIPCLELYYLKVWVKTYIYMEWYDRSCLALYLSHLSSIYMYISGGARQAKRSLDRAVFTCSLVDRAPVSNTVLWFHFPSEPDHKSIALCCVALSRASVPGDPSYLVSPAGHVFASTEQSVPSRNWFGAHTCHKSEYPAVTLLCSSSTHSRTS